MIVRLLVFTFFMAFFISMLEINIEGKKGWAENLPTWRVKNKFTRLLLGDRPLTGYHLWFWLMGVAFLQFPFFIGLSFNLALELQIFAVFLWGIVIEDFFWFVLNPAFGIKKFNKKYVDWHEWIGFLPRSYYIYAVIGLVLIFISYQI